MTILLSLIFGLGAGSALVYLTRPVVKDVKSQRSVVTLAAETGVPCWLTVRSAHPMKSVRVLKANEDLELDALSESEVEAELLASEEVTVKLLIKWEEGTPETAVLIRLEPEAQLEIERTIWAEGTLTQEVTFNIESNGN